MPGNRSKSEHNMRHKSDDDIWFDDFPVILGQGTVHDLSDGDPRNPKLSGLRSVSYAGAVGLAKREKPKARAIGFHRPK